MQLNNWITRSIAILVATIAAAFATGSASADGYYQRRGVVPLAGCANFGGFYAGGNIGWATFTAHQNDLDGFLNDGVATSFTGSDDSFMGGVQAGYNLQKGCTVFGIEADWNWADLNADTHILRDRLIPTLLDDSFRTRINDFGTIRTRAGVVVDQLLLYVTGGVAWAESRDSIHRAFLGVNDRFSSDDTRWGWTAGFGTEYKLTPGISLTSDVLYLNFTDEDHSFVAPDFGRFRARSEEEIWVARMGINIHFGDRRDFVAPLK